MGMTQTSNPAAQAILDQMIPGTKVEIHCEVGKPAPHWFPVQTTEVAGIRGKSVVFANGTKVAFRGLHRAIVIL